MMKSMTWIVLSAALSLPVGCGDFRPFDDDGRDPRAPQSESSTEDAEAAAGAVDSPSAGDAATTRDERTPTSEPNIVLVLVDTLRPGFLGFHGFEYETAPFLAELAEAGTVCAKSRAPSSWTAPSTASLFTSHYPPQHGVVQGYRAHLAQLSAVQSGDDAEMRLNRIPDGMSTLPEALKAAGYRTFGLAANINIGDEIGFSRGFDRFEKHTRASAGKLISIVEQWKPEITAGEPYLLYLHLNDVHSPYDVHREHMRPAKGVAGGAKATRYRSEIGYVDDQLRRLFELLELDGSNTLIAVVSDHGEEFGDHGGFGHGKTLYSELTRVLTMFHGPRVGIRRQVLQHNVSLIDVMPTLIDIVGAEQPEHHEGVSLVPLLLSGRDGANELRQRLERRPLFSYRVYSSRTGAALWAIMRGDWKMIDWFGKRRRLYDHREDLAERHDLTDQKPDLAAALLDRLEGFKERMNKHEPANEQAEIVLDEELLGRLDRLGYILPSSVPSTVAGEPNR
jgi:arylsulfatase A-like enzyme